MSKADVAPLTSAITRQLAKGPDRLEQARIDRLGPGQTFRRYVGTEGQAATTINGNDRLAPGGAEADGRRVIAATPTAKRYRPARGARCGCGPDGAEAHTREGGWKSLGDNGQLDAEVLV